MSPVVASLNFYLALGGIIAFLLTAILLIDLKRERALKAYINHFGLRIAFFIALGSSAMALIYSEVFGFVPCGFCWLERIFLFPQVVLLGVAIYIKDTRIALYGLVLSVVGLIISLYHHYIQVGGTAFVKCPTAGATDCAKRIMFEFDFMTFPLVAAAGFVLLGSLYYYMMKVASSR